MKAICLRSFLELSVLEPRINCSYVVVNTKDYDPRFYDEGNPATYEEGSARWAIQKAIESSDHVVEFNTNPLKGTVFNDPANPVTIELPFGEIKIFDDNTGKDANGNDVGWGFDQLDIRGPKYFDSAATSVYRGCLLN